MSTVVYLSLAFAALVALRPVARAYLKFRGARVVTCPETKAPAAVELDARHAAFTAAFGEPDLRLKDCSRWPQRRECGQECLEQIELAPMECLARTMLTGWYEGKSCALCRKAFGEIQWLDHKPALLSPERNAVEWHEVRAEKLPEVLATHRALCWNCLVAETFRRRFPELVVERPWKSDGPYRSA